MTGPASVGALMLGLSPEAAHAALDLAEGSINHDGSALWLHDGIPAEAFDLVAALSKLAAVLAMTLAADRRDLGQDITALQVLGVVRAAQEPRS